MSLIKMEQIGKTFGAVKALENVDFELKKGEIHALLGENGAGKTTLMKVLYGMYRADKGSLYYEDKKVEINNSREAIEHMVTQIKFLSKPIIKGISFLS